MKKKTVLSNTILKYLFICFGVVIDYRSSIKKNKNKCPQVKPAKGMLYTPEKVALIMNNI